MFCLKCFSCIEVRCVLYLCVCTYILDDLMNAAVCLLCDKACMCMHWRSILVCSKTRGPWPGVIGSIWLFFPELSDFQASLSFAGLIISTLCR